jgi:hypothetical protein
MPLSKRFGICLLLTASAFAQAQNFVAIDVKPTRSVDLQSRRVRTLPNGDLIGTSVKPRAPSCDGTDRTHRCLPVLIPASTMSIVGLDGFALEVLMTGSEVVRTWVHRAGIRDDGVHAGPSVPLLTTLWGIRIPVLHKPIRLCKSTLPSCSPLLKPRVGHCEAPRNRGRYTMERVVLHE